MSAALDRLRGKKHDYLDALDVMGDFDVGSFVPWLNMVSSLAGGGKKDDAAAKRAAEEKARQEAIAARNRGILYTVFGVLGAGLLGTTVYLIARK